MKRKAVIVGVGELVDRDRGLSPREMIAEAIRKADADAGGGFVARADRLDVVSIASFDYLDLPGLLAEDIGAARATLSTTPVGGDMPVKALAAAAAAIAAGQGDIAILCGGEALKTRMKAAAEKQPLGWGPADPNAKVRTGADYVTPLAARYRLMQPSHIYPLYENAFREAAGQSFEEGQRESAEIWSALSEVAAGNETAWSGKAMPPEAIATFSPDNRPIAFPYPKFMNAQLGVNQSCAIIVAEMEVARAAGVSEERMIHIGKAVCAAEPSDFLARDRFDHAAAQDEVLSLVMDVNGVSSEEIDLVELYSCFPIVPKMARRLLGLGPDMALSVTGGLTFFGGPANNYMSHAIAAAVRAMRDGRGDVALLYGQGEFVTKHAAVILSTEPGAEPDLVSVQSGADARRGPVPTLLERYEGLASLETYTVLFDRDGAPEWAPVVLRTPAGDRVLAVATQDERTIGLLISGERGTIGTRGRVSANEEGLLTWTL